jgi:RNA polymerase sigma-70 factor (ECF subfamily)
LSNRSYVRHVSSGEGVMCVCSGVDAGAVSVSGSVGAVDPAVTATFEQFYTSTYRQVLVMARALCRGADDAADVTQEAFLAARRRWARVSAFDRPDLWVRRVAINRAISLQRRWMAERRALDRMPCFGPVTEDAPSDGELWALVRRLPARQAQVVVLVYAGDLSVEDTAQVLATSVSTVKTHLQRGRRALAAMLGEVES